MVCKNCGRTIQNEEANFCEYCGASFRPGMDNRVLEGEHNSSPSANGQDITIQQNLGQGSASQNGPWQTTYEQNTYGSNPMKDQVLGRYFTQNAFLALLFFWSFSKSVTPTKKNWARATLIVALILVVIIAMLIGATGGEILSDPTAIINSLYGK